MKNETILSTVKSLLGLGKDYTPFDDELIILINSAFSVINQIGIGTENPFTVTKTSTWADFLTDDEGYEWHLEMIKTYIYLKVRMTFDPPSSSFVAEEFNKQLAELEWRMYAFSDNKKYLKETE